MSSCEIFPLISKLSAEGKRFAIVSIYKGNRLERTLVADGRVLLGSLDKELIELSLQALEKGQVIQREIGNTKVVIEPIEPRPAIIVVGSGIIAKFIAKLAVDMGYYVGVVGSGDVKEEDFAGVYAISNDLNILEQMVSEDSIVIVANEGGKPYDIDALYIAMKKKARFVGLLASQKRAALMIALLMKRGIPLDEIKKRLHSPLGLDIGSKTAEEIALSILSEVVLELRGGSGKRLQEVKNPYLLLDDALAGKIEDKCMFVPKSMSEQ
ncbi:XdhC family protein [Sulfolobus tengchongensis]|uniref:XdhC family protein n=1 Tax=Sulfolobus tengchongensis TaxID=207809 RepID=A0AAX4KX02_9CREN